MDITKGEQKLVSLITAVSMCLTFAGCSNSESQQQTGESKPSFVEQKNTVDVKYTVKKNDTLTHISNYFGVSIEVIQKANNIENMNLISVGMKLNIPGVDVLIANKYYDMLKGEIILEEGTYVEYKIEYDDSLESIAEKFNITVEEIVRVNNISDMNTIYVGEVLKIPNVSTEIVDNGVGVDDNLPDGYTRGIDISRHQSNIDWDKLQKSFEKGEFSYIILRIAESWNSRTNSYGFALDPTFEKNLSECNKRGIPYGIYMFSRAYNEQMVINETSGVINYINNNLNRTKVVNGEELDLSFNLSLPFYMDCFEINASKQRSILDNGNYNYCQQLIQLWCSAIEDAGYFTGVYCGAEVYNKLGIDRLSDYSLWIAHYGSRDVPKYITDVVLNNRVSFNSIVSSQQVTEKATVDGIDGPVDVNITKEQLLELVYKFYASKSYNRHIGT